MYNYTRYTGKYKYTQESRLNELINYCHSQNGYFISGNYVNRNSRFLVRCEKGHTWEASFRSLVSEQHWCRVCNVVLKMTKNNPGTRKEVKDKIKNTWNRKYNGHPIFDKEISIKQARKINNPYVLYHWKTGKEIICQGSWEKKCVERWNQNKEDFQWQVKFQISNKKIYIVDAYLPKLNKYIEIKGYFRKDAKEKWDWFHKEYPNSELWDQKRLKELKIL